MHSTALESPVEPPVESPVAMGYALEDGVVLWSPGGAYLPDARVLVVADLHAGYVATLQKRGYTLPAQDDSVLHGRLRDLVARTNPATVVVAGDLVHGAAALGRPRVAGAGAVAGAGVASASALQRLLDVLAGRTVVVVPGNHDRSAADRLGAYGVTVTEVFTTGLYTVVHGDGDPMSVRAQRARAMERGGRLILGHHHPAMTLDDGAGTRARVPAFASAPGLLCLPALTPLARGADLLRTDHAEALTLVADPTELSLAVVVGLRVIPVGTLARVRAARRGAWTE